jgi:hypothetical protein
VTNKELKTRQLIAQIGDNASEGEHQAGYNGVWSLRAPADDENIFVPFYAGLNFEHIFDGFATDYHALYEPRHAAMELRQITEHIVELHQPPTPFWGLESWSRFTLVAPHFLDFSFRCIPRRSTFRHGYIGLFWASYMNAPENKSLYFRGLAPHMPAPQYLQFCTQHHNDRATVVHADEPQPRLAFAEDHPTMLFTEYSPLRYCEPFFYGRWKDFVFAVFFDRTDGLRFSHSPSGGGETADGSDTNPAWDWQFIIPDYEVGREYGYRARVVFKPFGGRGEIKALWEKWQWEIAPP